MRDEILVLALGAILLMVHVFAAVRVKTQQYGTKWNMGARDEAMPPLNALAGRLDRARGNFLETLPVAIIALFGVVVTGRADTISAIGGWVWLAARIVYLPLYAAGVPVVRTLVYMVSLIGLAMALFTLFAG